MHVGVSYKSIATQLKILRINISMIPPIDGLSMADVPDNWMQRPPPSGAFTYGRKGTFQGCKGAGTVHSYYTSVCEDRTQLFRQ
jgi:hypothetical protein